MLDSSEVSSRRSKEASHRDSKAQSHFKHVFFLPSTIKMTTATALGDTTFFSLNMTTRGEDFLYKSSGAIVAAVVVVVIVIFAVVLILLKTWNRKMKLRRELEPKLPKPAAPPALDPSSNSSQHPPAVTFSPVDVHVETR
ncbi:noncompact myelin-associated protein [Tupaia chinensis]|uniref:noncompact myelin-associated protein n=1 Tax=Tupaia chinensis TaxID=246437 RepID=UPI000703DD4F|nr:noncompact myelin-associated protein [Tupaia chinensis]